MKGAFVTAKELFPYKSQEDASRHQSCNPHTPCTAGVGVRSCLNHTQALLYSLQSTVDIGVHLNRVLWRP